MSNYRPIPMLCTISKVLEKVISNEITNHITTSLSPRQYGFLKGRSCVHKLLTSFSLITDSMDRNNPTDVIYPDIRKTFDSVGHHHLLAKLKNVGIMGGTWELMRSYLLIAIIMCPSVVIHLTIFQSNLEYRKRVFWGLFYS